MLTRAAAETASERAAVPTEQASGGQESHLVSRPGMLQQLVKGNIFSLTTKLWQTVNTRLPRLPANEWLQTERDPPHAPSESSTAGRKARRAGEARDWSRWQFVRPRTHHAPERCLFSSQAMGNPNRTKQC